MVVERAGRRDVSEHLLWYGDIGVRLYMPSGRFPRKEDIEDGERVMQLLRRYKVEDRIPITVLDQVDGERGYFDCIRDTSMPLALPILVAVHACSTGAVLGHSGYKEIGEFLEQYGRHIANVKGEVLGEYR